MHAHQHTSVGSLVCRNSRSTLAHATASSFRERSRSGVSHTYCPLTPITSARLRGPGVARANRRMADQYLLHLCHQVTRIQSRSAFDKVMQMRCEICRLGLCRTSRLTGTARHGPCHCVSGPGKAQSCKKRHSNDLTMSLVLEPRLVRPSSYVPPMYNKEAVVLCNILKSKTLHV